MLEGTFYMDGSCYESNISELARCGWGFVCIDEGGEIVGSAYGTCPPWVDDIGGAEAWAMLQVSLCSMPGRDPYWSDCLPLVQAVHKGSQVGTDPTHPRARVHSLLMAALEDTDPGCIGWMPSHLEKDDVGRAR